MSEILATDDYDDIEAYIAEHAPDARLLEEITAELDAGPIIAQDVTVVSHRDSVDDLVRKGRDLEQLVLARAVWTHLQRKVLCYDNRTVIFD